MNDVGQARYQKVRLDELEADGRFNRPIYNSHVEALAATFSSAAFGCLELWRREDGTLVILDGQHRRLAALMVGVPGDVKAIPALVHDGLTLDQAAELFVALNATRLVNPYDKFRALLIAGHGETCDINRIVQGQGLRVAGGKADGTISAVTTLRRVYHMGDPHGTVMALALKTLRSAWADVSEAYEAPLLKGIALYFHQHRDTAPEMLADALVRGPGAPINLTGWAKAIAGPQRMPLAEAIAITIEKRVVKRPTRARKAS